MLHEACLRIRNDSLLSAVDVAGRVISALALAYAGEMPRSGTEAQTEWRRTVEAFEGLVVRALANKLRF